MGIRVIFYKFREITRKYPVIRGMAAYSAIWPAGCLIQQKFISKQELNYLQALRFSLYGGFFVAPTLYGWLTIATRIWPKNTFKSAITKALVEQVTYGPAAMCSFFFGMNLLEFKPVSECVEEVKRKFIPTWRMGICVWPVLQTINFVLIPERNRVVYVSVCSLMWTSFLAYMKALDAERLNTKSLHEYQPDQPTLPATAKIESSTVKIPSTSKTKVPAAP
ncbi:mpv17-like protein [Fopius arisanus]|uniref:Mpv17-like protein n=1 Tax=Fopius arisanus TaxID=64838 RepID=A0A0C9RNK6_9HYME|nr:PREDICTED: mpv17-like protein [Fopius arisanus]XP_011297304.1 PREDICTED: mpv17-like protein [Fopius arisanus]XP_011297305.1 PREDICTED: mpv17-like protein [Fopius arisanus]XP_011297306.1 PREDICTED: mpv17-like protein [Fopius arisanus]